MASTLWKGKLVKNRSPPPSPISKREISDSKEIKPGQCKPEKRVRKQVPGKLPGDEYCGWDENVDDYVCEICDSAMNSEHTFLMHMGGKRHQKKLAVARLTNEVKVEFPRNANMQEIRVGGEHKVLATKQVKKPSKIQATIDKEKQPVIGLSYVTEILRIDKKQDPVYHCSLCPADCQLSSVMGHITGLKHRLAYMKLNFPEMYAMLNSSTDKRSSMSDMAEYHARNIERKHGRGEMIVEEELDSKDIEIMEAMPLTDEETKFTKEKILEFPSNERMEFLLYGLDSVFEDHLESKVLQPKEIDETKNNCKTLKSTSLLTAIKFIDEESADRIESSLMESDQTVVKEIVQSPVLEVGEPTREVIRRWMYSFFCSVTFNLC